jgi:hypothetical protein
MSGIIPPSILALNYQVDGDFKKYVNISFPFRVQIEKIWFTADDGLSGEDDDGDPWDDERILRLGAVKTRNARETGGAPSDNNWIWGDFSASSKPTCWFGLPDYRDEATAAGNGDGANDEQVQYDDVNETIAVYRSTAKSLPSVNDMSSWVNFGNGDINYKTDLSVMNEDEFLSVFVYSDGGDWSNYTPYSGTATIFVSYTGVGGSSNSAPTRIWD